MRSTGSISRDFLTPQDRGSILREGIRVTPRRCYNNRATIGQLTMMPVEPYFFPPGPVMNPC